MSKNKKILMILLFSILILIIISNNIFAATISTGDITNDKKLGDADTKLESIGTRIFTAVSNVGIILSVVMLAVMGIRYMLGSVEEKAEYKKSMMPYLIGALLIFGASTIGRIVYNIFSKV